MYTLQHVGKNVLRKGLKWVGTLIDRSTERSSDLRLPDLSITEEGWLETQGPRKRSLSGIPHPLTPVETGVIHVQ